MLCSAWWQFNILNFFHIRFLSIVKLEQKTKQQQEMQRKKKKKRKDALSPLKFHTFPSQLQYILESFESTLVAICIRANFC